MQASKKGSSTFLRSHAAFSRATTSLTCVPLSQRFYTTQQNKRTALYDLHVKLGGKMVEFCGWDMPVQYNSLDVKESHIHTRTEASLFDVSHMGQLRITGKDRVAFLEQLVVADVAGLPLHQARLSVFTNEQGGIKDDTMITNAGDYLYVVVNAGCAEKDIAHLLAHQATFRAKGKDVNVHVIQDHSLIALQGPKAATVLNKYVKEDLSQVAFMTGKEIVVDGTKCRVTRCGYTGEDGFEISVPTEKAVALSNTLLGTNPVQPAGLAARDSLRLEACLCLYGNDIDETTTPIEAGLAWTIGKRRRAEGGFLGADVILKQLKEGVTRKRVGILINQGLARAHSPVQVGDKQVSELTSGGWGPTINQGIGMAYLPTELSKDGQQLQISVRKKLFPAQVAKMPLVPTHFYKGF